MSISQKKRKMSELEEDLEEEVIVKKTKTRPPPLNLSGISNFEVKIIRPVENTELQKCIQNIKKYEEDIETNTKLVLKIRSSKSIENITNDICYLHSMFRVFLNERRKYPEDDKEQSVIFNLRHKSITRDIECCEKLRDEHYRDLKMLPIYTYELERAQEKLKLERVKFEKLVSKKS